MRKYINDLDKIQNNLDLNDLNEENEETREDVDRDIHNHTTDKIEVQHDNKEEEEFDPIKMYEEDENNSSRENEENEDERWKRNLLRKYCLYIYFLLNIS